MTPKSTPEAHIKGELPCTDVIAELSVALKVFIITTNLAMDKLGMAARRVELFFSQSRNTDFSGPLTLQGAPTHGERGTKTDHPVNVFFSLSFNVDLSQSCVAHLFYHCGQNDYSYRSIFLEFTEIWNCNFFTCLHVVCGFNQFEDYRFRLGYCKTMCSRTSFQSPMSVCRMSACFVLTVCICRLSCLLFHRSWLFFHNLSSFCALLPQVISAHCF